MKFHAQLSVLAACTLGLTVAASTSCADVFNWNNITYTSQTGGSIGNSTDGTNSASLQFTLSTTSTSGAGTAASFANVANVTYPSSSSYSQNNTYYVSGGVSDTQKALQIGANLSSHSATNNPFVTVTILFARPVTNVSFSFFDIDTNAAGGNAYIDQISSIQGRNGTNGTPTNLLVSNNGSTTTLTGNAQTGFTITGNATNAQNAPNGNATVSYNNPNAAIDRLSFTYSDNIVDANHGTVQIIGLGNITFTNQVPEPGTVALLGLGLFGTAGVVLRRRRR